MPEGDTVHTAAVRVGAGLGLKPITLVGGTKLAPHARRFLGAAITNVWSHGKHLLIEAGPWTVRTHLGMHGRWRTSPTPPRPSGTLCVMLATESGAAGCWSAPDVAVDRTPAIKLWLEAHLGPDLIRDVPTEEIIGRCLAHPTRTMAATLLDQKIAAGIGNVYKSELCFLAGVHPTTPVGSLGPARLTAIFQQAAELLRSNLHGRERVTTGLDRPGARLWVYGRPGRGCRRCNAPIEIDTAGDRVTYWCPQCQPDPALAD